MSLIIDSALALGWFNLFLILLFVFAETITVTHDRRHINEDEKWWVLSAGFLLFLVFFRNYPSEIGAVLTWKFWEPVFVYLGIGLLYSIIEFLFEVRREAVFYAAEWQKHFKVAAAATTYSHAGTFTLQEIFVDVGDKGACSRHFNAAHDTCMSFIRKHMHDDRIIKLKPDESAIYPTAHVYKAELIGHISAWTLLWPFYLLSLVLGNLLTQFFHAVVNALVRFSGAFVRLNFANTFKPELRQRDQTRATAKEIAEQVRGKNNPGKEVP